MRNNIFFFLFLIFFISCTPETVTGNDDESEQTNDNSADEDNVNDETDQTTGTTDDESEDNRDYKLVWQDLFDSEELDESVWNIEVNGNGGGNNELQYYSGNNVSIGAEPETGKHCLILTAKKESYQGKSATSGRINSKGKKYFKYGRIEASIKLPKTANGLWPAFWMMGNDYDQVGWPKCGEIEDSRMIAGCRGQTAVLLQKKTRGQFSVLQKVPGAEKVPVPHRARDGLSPHHKLLHGTHFLSICAYASGGGG